MTTKHCYIPIQWVAAYCWTANAAASFGCRRYLTGKPLFQAEGPLADSPIWVPTGTTVQQLSLPLSHHGQTYPWQLIDSANISWECSADATTISQLAIQLPADQSSLFRAQVFEPGMKKSWTRSPTIELTPLNNWTHTLTLAEKNRFLARLVAAFPDIAPMVPIAALWTYKLTLDSKDFHAQDAATAQEQNARLVISTPVCPDFPVSATWSTNASFSALPAFAALLFEKLLVVNLLNHPNIGWFRLNPNLSQPAPKLPPVQQHPYWLEADSLAFWAHDDQDPITISELRVLLKTKTLYAQNPKTGPVLSTGHTAASLAALWATHLQEHWRLAFWT